MANLFKVWTADRSTKIFASRQDSSDLITEVIVQGKKKILTGKTN